MLNERVLNSGIFKTKTIDDNKIHDGKEIKSKIEIPVGVYRLWRKDQLSKKKIIPEVDAEIFHAEIVHQLQNFLSSDRKFSDAIDDITEDHISEIEKHFCNLLSDSFDIPKKEAKKHVQRATRMKSFKNLIRKKVEADDEVDEIKAFKQTKGNQRHYKLIVPLYKLFEEHLKTNKDNTYYYLAHFLVGMKIEKPTVQKAYQRIKKFETRSSI